MITFCMQKPDLIDETHLGCDASITMVVCSVTVRSCWISDCEAEVNPDEDAATIAE